VESGRQTVVLVLVVVAAVAAAAAFASSGESCVKNQYLRALPFVVVVVVAGNVLLCSR